MGRMRNRAGIACLVVAGTALLAGTFRLERDYRKGERELRTAATMQENIQKARNIYDPRNHMEPITGGVNAETVNEAAIILAYKLYAIFKENDVEFSYRNLRIDNNGLTTATNPEMQKQMEKWNIDRQNVVAAMDGILTINEGRPVRMQGLRGQYMQYDMTELIKNSGFYRRLFYDNLVKNVKNLLDYDSAIDAHYRTAIGVEYTMPQAFRKGVLEGTCIGFGLNALWGLFLFGRYRSRRKKEQQERDEQARFRKARKPTNGTVSVPAAAPVIGPASTIQLITNPVEGITIHSPSPTNGTAVAPRTRRERRAVVDNHELEAQLERRLVKILSGIIKTDYVISIAHAIAVNCHGHATRTLEEAMQTADNMIAFLRKNGWILKHLEVVRDWTVLASDGNEDKFKRNNALA